MTSSSDRPTGRRFTAPSFVSDVLLPSLERAEFRDDVTVHSLRHSFASALVQQGTPVNEVAGLLGHSSHDITMRVYTHWLRDTKTSAIDRLADAIFGDAATKAQ
jgi:integrase